MLRIELGRRARLDPPHPTHRLRRHARVRFEAAKRKEGPLQRMLAQVALERGKPTFGTCASCTHLEGGDCSREGVVPYACGFASEPLLLVELDEVCINFVQGKPMTVKGAVIGTAPR